MAQFRISPEFRAALKARLESPEGQQALDELARLIAETAFEATPSDLRETLGTEGGDGGILGGLAGHRGSILSRRRIQAESYRR